MQRRLGTAALALLVVVTTGCGADPEVESTRADTGDARTDVDAEAPERPAEAAPSSTAARGPAVAGDEGGATDHPAPTTTASPTARPTATVRSTDDRPVEGAPDRYVPAAGAYRYAQTGYRETAGINGGRESVSPSSTDTVTLAQAGTGTRITVLTEDAGRDSTQEMVVDVSEDEARLVRLTSRSASTGLGFDVRPDPPALVARLPYADGDEWEIAWNDPASGVSGVGTGTVVTGQRVQTPSGEYPETVRITVEQRLRGTVEGTLTVTSWIDPSTGVQVKQHVVTDVDDATGSSRQDTTRVLEEFRP